MLFFRRNNNGVKPTDNIYLIVGLGNIGKKYDATRHNIGFMAVEELAREYSCAFKNSRTGKGEESSVNIGGNRLIFFKPNTYMNRSGDAVAAIMKYYKIPKSKLLIISDDINLPVGKLRFRAKGSDGGHNGLWNISNRIGGDDYARLRIGVGTPPEEMDQADYVLGRFLSAEKTAVDMAITRAADGVKIWMNNGIEAAANEYNGL